MIYAKNLVINSSLLYRFDFFGGLAWFPKGEIYKLDTNHIFLLSLFNEPRDISKIKRDYFDKNVQILANKLLDIGLLKYTSLPHIEIEQESYEKKLREIKNSQKRSISKPFWVHIQPFKYCNQKCIHCYCNADNKQEKFTLSLETWKKIVDKLKIFGILDIYVTGGENLIVNDYYCLTEYIISNGFGTGLSTNGMHISDEAIEKLKLFKLDYIQVSLDGATAETNDLIRGRKGAFNKTIDGIRKIQRNDLGQVAINTVVNKYNLYELEEIIQIGQKLGIKEFKFFPQKLCGRAKNYPKMLLNYSDYKKYFQICESINKKEDVVLDYISPNNDNDRCGSGDAGFSINEYGDIYPCIFGIENSNQCLGNIIKDDLDFIWFDSSKLNNFRQMSKNSLCRRCESHEDIPLHS